ELSASAVDRADVARVARRVELAFACGPRCCAHLLAVDDVHGPFSKAVMPSQSLTERVLRPARNSRRCTCPNPQSTYCRSMSTRLLGHTQFARGRRCRRVAESDSRFLRSATAYLAPTGVALLRHGHKQVHGSCLRNRSQSASVGRPRLGILLFGLSLSCPLRSCSRVSVDVGHFAVNHFRMLDDLLQDRRKHATAGRESLSRVLNEAAHC